MLGRAEFARELVERFVDERGFAGQRLVQRIECRRACSELLAVARELEARIDAEPPHVGEVVDVQAREITRLLRRAERAERGMDLLVERLLEARALRQKRAPDDAKRQARIAALQEADRRFHGVGVALGVLEKVSDRNGGTGARLPGCLCAPAQILRHARDQRRGEQTQEQRDRRVGLGDFESEILTRAGAGNPVRYAVAGYGVLSWIIGGVTSRTRMRSQRNARMCGYIGLACQDDRNEQAMYSVGNTSYSHGLRG